MRTIYKNVLEKKYNDLKIKYDKLFKETYPLVKKNKKLIEIRKILDEKID